MRVESRQEIDANLNMFYWVEKEGKVFQHSTGNIMVKTCFGVGTDAGIDAANSMRCSSFGSILEVVGECVFGFDPDLQCRCNHRCSLCL